MGYEENLTGYKTIGIRLEQYMELVKKSDMLGLHGSGKFDHDIQITDEAFVDCMQIINELPSAQP